MSEKQGYQLLPTPLTADNSAGRFRASSSDNRRRTRRTWVLLTALCFYGVYSWFHRLADLDLTHNHADASCPQEAVLNPVKNNEVWNGLNDKIGTAQFKQSAVKWLSGAVRVPTESYDNMPPVGQDPRWEAFGPFHDYLRDAFPLVHSTLSLTKVNTYGLVYEWKGSDADLKPLLLAAHQGNPSSSLFGGGGGHCVDDALTYTLADESFPSLVNLDVVPVDATTVDQWVHPPYSGHFDGERIWGRGSSDDKSGLIGILSSVESLIQANFQPTRTVVLSFGFDEESSGLHGARKLGEHLENVYGKNSFAMIVDEGSGFAEQYGTTVATPGVAEKGFINVMVEVASPGGHSSVPPDHTSIGILSALLVQYEKHPYPAKITRTEPVYQTLQCMAQHGKSVPKELREVIQKSARSKSALKDLQKFIKKDRLLRSLVSTTQAIDLVHGGVKTNALPEQAWAIVNHRVAITSSVAEVQAHDTELLSGLAKKFNLTYKAFGAQVSPEDAPSSGSLTLSDAFDASLPPAPITPTKGEEAGPYKLLSGTIKATFNAHRSLQSTDDNVNAIIVAPGMMTGNTDTKYYWALTPHIFRYNHHNSGKADNPLSNGIHTVNEWIDVDAFLEMIRFFTTLILNADEATSL